jgi:hypothetical protein
MLFDICLIANESTVQDKCFIHISKGPHFTIGFCYMLARVIVIICSFFFFFLEVDTSNGSMDISAGTFTTGANQAGIYQASTVSPII